MQRINVTMATAAERAKRALAGGSGAEPQVRVRVSVRLGLGIVYGWICIKICILALKKSVYEIYQIFPEVLVFAVTSGRDDVTSG